MPVDTRLLLTAPPYSPSLYDNRIGTKGASALAATLKETQITKLKCATTPSVFAFVSAPLDRLTSHLHTPPSQS